VIRRPSSLSSRLVLTAVGLVLLVSVLVSVTTTLAMRSLLTNRLDDDVRASMSRTFDVFSHGVPVGQDGGGPPTVRGTGPGTVQALLGSGRSVGWRLERSGASTPLSDHALDALAEVPSDGKVHEVSLDGIGHYRVVADDASSNIGPVKVVSGLPTRDLDETVGSLMLWEIGLSLAGVALAYGAGVVLVRRTLRPLRDVARTAQEVTTMPLDTGSVGETVRVPDDLTDERTEVGSVGASLNRLLGHVEQALDARHRSEQQVRQFVADASHELRTPLTTIRGYAELAGRSPEALPTSMDKVSAEAERMTVLVEDLLLLARLDSGRPLVSEKVDLTRLVVDSVSDSRVVAPTHSWALCLPEEPVVVLGDEQRLHQVVTNLLGNARGHTPPGTTVTTSLTPRDDSVVLAVHDTGPGLPRSIEGKVFERFTRADTSRTRASGGAGLGLSLVAAIAAGHGGSVAVDSGPGGTTFTVTLLRES
jgi:two-component system, OmpR family, sensor kinase